MNRAERKATASVMRKQALAWPAHLVPVPESLVLEYGEPPFDGVECRRLTVNRVTIRGDGHWEQDIPWDDLQRCKREAGYGDWYALEIYPRDRDIVHIANMRHLWLLAEPLQLGWFEGQRP